MEPPQFYRISFMTATRHSCSARVYLPFPDTQPHSNMDLCSLFCKSLKQTCAQLVRCYKDIEGERVLTQRLSLIQWQARDGALVQACTWMCHLILQTPMAGKRGGETRKTRMCSGVKSTSRKTSLWKHRIKPCQVSGSISETENATAGHGASHVPPCYANVSRSLCFTHAALLG